MLDRFMQWTTQLNQTDHVAFAIVTVLTMATIGVLIAVVAEVLLVRLSGGKSRAPEHQHPPGH